ncbi:M23 family metallopeptidase [Georgenia ruanii]|uniref:Peptidoglycan DD-metalloendopeptidase family protein n=1 Tax=Georgenia ruanii TaxID=348442 RepID=A0A7J9V0Y6_9MICO|nr:M23 family metallopeptidase [Georgenia ruanii]MPV89790.1 peptidoglycan DD-metalloendopeptidase family protein [Georgenia ruanii]
MSVDSKTVAQMVAQGHATPAADSVATEVLALATGPRRRDLRDGSPRSPRPRALMAGTLAALAILTPVVGTSGLTDGAVAATGHDKPNALAAIDVASPEANTPESLRNDPAAASRAAERQAVEEAQKAAEAAAAEEARKAAEAAAAEEARRAAEAAAAEEARKAAEAANRVVSPIAGPISLTSSYGHRNDPLGRSSAYSFHLGQDIAAPRNTPIHAAAAGTVTHAGAGINGRSNNLIIIQHNINGQTFYTWYVHMYDDGVYVTPGQQVAAGDVIGGVGSNGNSTGPHLHFEVHDAADNTMNPLTWLQQHGAI